MTDIKPGLSFDLTADDYDAVRPGYPLEMYKDLIASTNLKSTSKILDIGSGTGQAAIPFLKKSYDLTCLEPGIKLFKLLKKNTDIFANAACVNSTFENWESLCKFDLIMAATSFHWLNLKISLPKIIKFLNHSGIFAVIWNVHPKPYIGFFKEVQEVYSKNFPQTGIKKNWKTLSAKRDEVIDQIQDSCLFKIVMKRSYEWSQNFYSDEYVRLLKTFSDNIMLTDKKRTRLLTEIKELIDTKYMGMIERPYRTELFLFEVR